MSSLWGHGSSSSVQRQKASTSSYVTEKVMKLKKVDELMRSISKDNQKNRLLSGNKDNGVGPKTTAYQRCKGAVSDVRSPSNGQSKTKPRMLSSNGGVQKNLEDVPSKGKLGGARERSPSGSESSTPEKNRCSKMPFMSYLKSKIDAAGSVLGKTKRQRAKQVREANSYSRSSSDMPVVGKGYDECDLSSEQDSSDLNLLPEGFYQRKPTSHLSNLNLLPEGFSQRKPTNHLSDSNLLPEGFYQRKPTKHWPLTPESRRTFNVHEFHVFDGSRFSPMEEASLVLEDVPAKVVNKEEQIGSSRNAFEWSSFDKSTASGSTSGESCFDSSCISSSLESLSTQANMEDLNSLPLHSDHDKIACSDLQQHDLRESLNETSSHLFENEANKVAEELVAKAVKSVELSRNCSFDDTLLCEYNNRRRSFFPMEQSLLQLDDINGEGSHEPLFWPFNPKSYFSDEYNLENSSYRMDSNCKPKNPSPDGLSSNPLQSKFCNVSKKKSDRHLRASMEPLPKDRACDLKKHTTTDKLMPCDLKEQTTTDESILSRIKASNSERLAFLSDDTTLSKNINTPFSRKLSADSTARTPCENILSEHCQSKNSSMYSNNYLSSANNNWKVIPDKALANIPEMQTECYVTADDSIESLLGMKEFDGQEGLQGTANEEKGDQDPHFEDCVCKYGQFHGCGRSDLIYNSKLPIRNLEHDFQYLQINPKHNATKGLLNTGNQDCNVRIEDKFENVERPVCCAMEKRFIEGTAKSLQCTSACILDEGTIETDLDKSKEIEEIKTVMDIDHDSNPLPTTVISFIEKKLKSFQYNGEDVKNLAPCEDVGMERKIEALEAELLKEKMKNKRLERSLKRALRKTNAKEQSLHGRQPVFCKFALHQRRRRQVSPSTAI